MVHATDLKMIMSGGSIMIWNVVVYYQKDRLYKSLSDITRDSLSADHNIHSQNVIINYVWIPLLQPVTDAQLRNWFKQIWKKKKNPERIFNYYHLHSTQHLLHLFIHVYTYNRKTLLSGQGFVFLSLSLEFIKGIPLKGMSHKICSVALTLNVL